MTTDPIVYQLLTPVTVGGQTLTSLNLREPTVGELDRAQSKAATQMGVVILLITLIAGVSEAEVRKLGQRDWNAVNAYLEGFMLGGPAAGDIASRTSPDGSAGDPASAPA